MEAGLRKPPESTEGRVVIDGLDVLHFIDFKWDAVSTQELCGHFTVTAKTCQVSHPAPPSLLLSESDLFRVLMLRRILNPELHLSSQILTLTSDIFLNLLIHIQCFVANIHDLFLLCVQPFGVLHGGITAFLAETLASMGAQVNANWARVAGIDLNVNHLLPVALGDELIVKATPLRVGKRVQVPKFILLHQNLSSTNSLQSYSSMLFNSNFFSSWRRTCVYWF